jgi:SSS family solute:Na+ symporter
MAPVIGAAFKMAVPLIVILPGLICLGLMQNGHPLFHLVPGDVAKVTGQPAYDQVLPLMLIRYCGPGLLGLGITALVAGFMSGMAGNVSAFSTVWTYDLYGAYINKKASDKHYVLMGRTSTVIGMLISIGTAYLVMNAASIMDYVQALFSFFIAPLFGTVILGMLWKRATSAGGFLGLLAGTASSIGMFFYTSTGSAAHKAMALSHIALSPDAQPMAENMFRALWSWLICVSVTVAVSYMTKPKSDAELNGLVYGATVIPHDGTTSVFQKPIFWAGVVGVIFIALNLIFF